MNLHFPGITLLPPIIVYIALVVNLKKLRNHTSWLSIGKIDRLTFILMAMMTMISAIALVAWAYALKPDLNKFLEWIPSWSRPVLILGGVGFALFNSFVEELIFRGILWEGLTSSIRSNVLITILQALIFGLWHYRGFPGGISGVFMVFVWGIFLGLVRNRSKGMLAPMVSHFFADLAIFSILYIMLQR
ncbi:MAG: CPBP family intramembrane metalloprotease [Spirochaetota bacterium]|nr:MAG: CPBP family intramembrane metalloprotease [Spirochaetota bacterium]